MDRPITRRDFLNGIAIGATAAASAPLFAATPANAGIPPLSGAAQDALGYYPPLLTGMRDGQTWPAAADTGEEYDLIVVGGGISGLAVA
jgi:spermidine dehydrogenase